MDLVAFIPRTKVRRHNPTSRWYEFPLPSFPHETELGLAKKYDTIVKGFKVLEASYEESQKKLAVTEERISTIDAAHAALIAEMETAQRILYDRETVR